MAVPDRSIPVASSRRPDKDSSFEEGAAVVLGTSHKHVFLEYQERVNLVQDLMKDSRYTGVQEEFESFDCIPAFVCGYVKTNHWARTVYNYTRNDKWGPQLLQVKAGAAGPKPPVDECPDLCELDQKLLAQLVNKECAVKGKGQDGATGGDDYKVGDGGDNAPHELLHSVTSLTLANAIRVMGMTPYWISAYSCTTPESRPGSKSSLQHGLRALTRASLIMRAKL